MCVPPAKKIKSGLQKRILGRRDCNHRWRIIFLFFSHYRKYSERHKSFPI